MFAVFVNFLQRFSLKNVQTGHSCSLKTITLLHFISINSQYIRKIVETTKRPIIRSTKQYTRKRIIPKD